MSDLAPACPKCEPLDGYWQMLETGLVRCNCPRGLALAGFDAQREKQRKEKSAKAASKSVKKKKERHDRYKRMHAAEKKLEKKYRELPILDEAPNHYGND
jgi:hypothetical protein